MDKFITGILKKMLQIIVRCLKNFQQEQYFFGYLSLGSISMILPSVIFIDVYLDNVQL